MEAYRRRAFVSIQLGNLTEARADVTKSEQLAPEDSVTFALQGDLLTAEERFLDAVAAYDKSLSMQPSAAVEFARALALLLAGRAQEACEAYRKGLESATPEDLSGALRDLDVKAAGRPGTDECRAILIGGHGNPRSAPRALFHLPEILNLYDGFGHRGYPSPYS